MKGGRVGNALLFYEKAYFSSFRMVHFPLELRIYGSCAFILASRHATSNQLLYFMKERMHIFPLN
jgi:hypothetical protein